MGARPVVSSPACALRMILAAGLLVAAGAAAEAPAAGEPKPPEKVQPEPQKVTPLPDMEAPAQGWASVKPNPQVEAMADNTWMELKTRFVPDGAVSYADMKFGRDHGGIGHPKGESCMVYDDARNVTIWFGGCSSGYTNQTLLLSVSDATWYQAQPEHVEYLVNGHQKAAGPNRPMGQCSYGACYDPDDKLYVKGKGITGGFAWEKPQKVWGYDAAKNKWEDLGEGGPNGQGCYKLVYDRDSKLCVQFGGLGISGTWLFDVPKRQWREAKAAGQSPPFRWYHCMVYDEKNRKTVLFGGGAEKYASGKHHDDTWAFDAATSTWTEMKPKTRPPARKMAAMAYDAANAVCVLINGSASTKEAEKKFLDTWVYDLAKDEWQEMKPASQPPLPGPYQAAYDRVNNVTVYVSGGQTHLYRYKKAGKGP